MKIEQTPGSIDWPQDGALIAETIGGFPYQISLTRGEVTMRVNANELKVILQAVGWLK